MWPLAISMVMSKSAPECVVCTAVRQGVKRLAVR